MARVDSAAKILRDARAPEAERLRALRQIERAIDRPGTKGAGSQTYALEVLADIALTEE